MDLSKLTPAPWLLGDDGWPIWFDGDKGALPYWASAVDKSPENPYKPDAISFDTLAFVALARNAFDVMMRRGWHPVKLGDLWHVTMAGAGKDAIKAFWARHLGWPDPFTALVEADRWMKENIRETKYGRDG